MLQPVVKIFDLFLMVYNVLEDRVVQILYVFLKRFQTDCTSWSQACKNELLLAGAKIYYNNISALNFRQTDFHIVWGVFYWLMTNKNKFEFPKTRTKFYLRLGIWQAHPERGAKGANAQGPGSCGGSGSPYEAGGLEQWTCTLLFEIVGKWHIYILL